MSEPTKKHPISAHSHGSIFYVTEHNKTYAIPKKVANRYLVEEKKPKKSANRTIPAKVLFARLEKKYTRVGLLLKGLRASEDLTQVAFAKKINVAQANLSKMENGRRPVGKIIAKRIEKIFGTDYRRFLE
jgi:DNA-binding XRE family transcriptional regulator